SDGAVISGNYPTTPQEWVYRVETFHRPSHHAVATTIDSVANATGRAPLVRSLHSFTPAWKGIPRPSHAAVLWDSDQRAVGP
ncbi:N-formylglutamate amidohydrolase, partial [Rhizobium ruizarguesonis]